MNFANMSSSVKIRRQPCSRSAPFVSSGFAKHFEEMLRKGHDASCRLDEIEAEFDALSNHFRDFAASKPSIGSASSFTLLEECLLEGLLSRCWQSWCIFCRTCVIALVCWNDQLRWRVDPSSATGYRR